MPFSIRVGGGDLPMPAVLGAVLAALAWVSVVVTHSGARWVGFGWLVGGVVLYVTYRKTQGKPLLKRVVVPERALRGERRDAEYGSILVPILGGALDDDIVQTAGRLAAEEDAESFEGDHGATIEALWVFEVPMSLPIDARAARRAAQARPRRRWRGPRRWGRSTRASRSRPRPSALAAPGRRSSTRRGAAACRRS